MLVGPAEAGAVLSLPEAVGLLLCLALSAFFSGSETALFSLRRSRVEELARGGAGRRGRAVAQLLARPHELLVTVLFGNLLANLFLFGLFALVAFRFEERGQAGLAAAVGVGGLAVVVVLGEVVPKSLAVVVAEPLALWAGPVVATVGWALRPVLATFLRVSDAVSRLFVRGPAPPHITADELKMLVELSEEQGLIGAGEQGLLLRVVEVGEMSVRDVMLPRVDVPFFELGRPWEELVALVRQTRRELIPVLRQGAASLAQVAPGSSSLPGRDAPRPSSGVPRVPASPTRAPASPMRAPAFPGGADAVVGVVRSARVLLEPAGAREAGAVEELVEPVALVPESWTVDELLGLFRRRGLEVAVVVDEYGGTSGLLRLSDLVQAVVGEMPAEAGPASVMAEAAPRPSVDGLPVAPGSFLVDAGLSIRALESLVGRLDQGAVGRQGRPSRWERGAEKAPRHSTGRGTRLPVTVGGLVTTLLGRWPVVGDQVECRSADGRRNLRFTVTEMAGLRLTKVRVEVLAAPDVGSTKAP
jgi:putative hemolysin